MTLVGVNIVKSDKEELRQLYERHGRGLIAYACTFLRGFAAAEDVLHQVFERLLRGDIELTDSPAPYLYRAVRNASLNYMRDRSRDSELTEDWLESPAGMDDSGLVLQSALREIPEEQREMIVLRIWGQMSFDEAADTLGISPKTAAYGTGTDCRSCGLSSIRWQRIERKVMDFEDNEYESLLRQFQPRKPELPPQMRTAPRTRRPAFWLGVAAAVVLMGTLSWVIPSLVWKVDAHAVVESVDGSVNHLSDGHSQIAQAGSRIAGGEILHTDSGARATFALADGSRVEMRSQSDVGLESADDGVRIRLNSGGIIVTAARQGKGHLYVQTRDLTVWVVETVFYVTAEQVGSRVAVVGGEVHVQQGQTVKKLLPGEQIATEPSMLSIPVVEEIAFSRMAPTHLAMLQQQSTVPVEPRLTFEEISIRPASQGFGGGGARGGGGLGGGGGRGGIAPGGPVCGGMIQLSPGRIMISNMTLYRLINLAYGKNCRASSEIDLIAGVPDWGRSQAFDIQATIPAGSVAYTLQQLNNGEAPKLQSMLQNLLADRFSFALHRDTKEIPIYNLVLVKPGKFKVSEDQTPPERNLGSVATGLPALPRDPNAPMPRGGFLFTVNPPEGKVRIAAVAVPLSMLINIFQGQEGRLVIDKTGMKGLYDIPETDMDVGPFDIAPGAVSVWPDIMQQLGMKLEPARGLGEVLVIDRVEKPSEN